MHPFSAYAWNDLPRLALLALLYALLAKISITFATGISTISLLWLPTGLALAALLIYGKKYWPAIYLGAVCFYVQSDKSFPVAMSIALGNTLEALCGFWLLTRDRHFDGTLRRVHDFFRLLFLAGFVSTSVSALIGVGALSVAGLMQLNKVPLSLLQWWMGDMLSVVLFTPLILVWRRPPRRTDLDGRLLELGALFGLLVVCCGIVFLDWFQSALGPYARGFLMYIFVAWGALRFGRHGVLLVTALVLLLALLGVSRQTGFFGSDMAQSGLFNFWLYFAVLTSVGMALATSIRERKTTEKKLRVSEERWSLALEGAGEGVWDWHLAQDRVFYSARWKSMYGYAEDEIGSGLDEWRSRVHPDDLQQVLASQRNCLENQTDAHFNEHRMRCKDGSWKWIQTRGMVVSRSADGSPLRMVGTHTDLTERKQVEIALQQSEARFTSFMQHLPGVAYIKDAQRRFLYVNKAQNVGPGLTPAEYLNQTLEYADALSFPASALAQSRADDEIVLRQQQLAQSELVMGEGDAQLTLLSIKFPLPDCDGRPLVGGIALDITARKQAETRIQRLTQLYKALSEIDQGIMRLADESELFPLVCRVAVDLAGMQAAWIGCINQDSGLIEAAASYGSGLGYLDGITISADTELPEGRGPSGIALRENRSVIINQYAHSPLTAPWHQRAAKHGIGSAASFPIPRTGQPFAVLNVYCEQADAFGAEEIALLEEMASDISFALDNLEREQQHRLAQQALRSSEQHFRAFFERSMVGMATSSPEKGWLAVNDALCQMLGYPREELLRLSWSRMTHPDDLAANLALFKRVAQDEIDDYAMDKRFIRKDGSIIHAHIAVRCLRLPDRSIDYFVTLVQDITAQKESEELIWKQANFDPLTGLFNRRMLHERLEQEIQRAQRTDSSVALLFIDLDHFKEVNDTLGHAAGDSLLVEAAQRISRSVRETDTVARLGGDEFMIILPQVPDAAQIDQIAGKILRRLAEPFQLGFETTYVSASIGVTLYPNDAGDIENLFKNADQAMYAAKNQGRNRYSYFTPALQEVAQARLKLIKELRVALSEQQFRVYFQPIVELSSQRIVKAEALIRWQHPSRGLVGPLEFIALAEETGLIIEIGHWVFQEAARWARRWSDMRPLQISVNVSPIQFRSDINNTAALLDQVWALGLPEGTMAVEITEGLLLHADAHITEQLARFRAAGVQVAIDDFGTGYSSLSYLKKFEIDYLKIDQSFVRNLATDPNDMALSEAIIVMAHKLGLKVIAEGVETEQQRAFLQAAGCDFAQGYLFSRPLPPQEFELLLAGP